MINYKKKYQTYLLLFILFPVVTIAGIILFMLLGSGTVQVIGTIASMLIFIVSISIIKPRLSFYKLKHKFEELTSVDLTINDYKVTALQLKEQLVSDGFIIHSSNRSLDTLYKVISKGTIWFPGQMKFEVAFIIHNEKYDFNHPKVAYALANLNAEIAKKAKVSTYSVLSFKYDNNSVDEEMTKKVMFSSDKKMEYTQINVLVNNNKMYYLENKEFYPNKQYKALCEELSLIINK